VCARVCVLAFVRARVCACARVCMCACARVREGLCDCYLPELSRLLSIGSTASEDCEQIELPRDNVDPSEVIELVCDNVARSEVMVLDKSDVASESYSV